MNALLAWMYAHCMYGCVRTACMPSVLGAQKRESDLLKLKLQMVVSLHVGTGNKIFILSESSQCF